MAKILITGGAGFLGSQLGYQLHTQGHQVILLDNMSYGRLDNLLINGEFFGEFYGADIRSKKVFEIMNDVDYVFHFAGIAPLPDCQSNPYDAIDTNVAGTVNILDAARFNGVKRVIFSSTSAIYEDNTSFPCTEDDEVSPYLVYPSSKLQSEMLCKSYAKTYGLDVVIVAPGYQLKLALPSLAQLTVMLTVSPASHVPLPSASITCGFEATKTGACASIVKLSSQFP